MPSSRPLGHVTDMQVFPSWKVHKKTRGQHFQLSCTSHSRSNSWLPLPCVHPSSSVRQQPGP